MLRATVPTFRIAVDVRAPVERVWAAMIDVERWPEWTASMRRVERLDSGPLAPGSRVRIEQPRLPVGVWTVTELRAPNTFAWVLRRPGVVATGTHSVWPAPAGSRVELALTFAGLLAGLIARIGRRLTERYLELESQGLKHRCEAAAVAG
jgi:uncharacterized protein YndB with AHSA1/START domain